MSVFDDNMQQFVGGDSTYLQSQPVSQNPFEKNMEQFNPTPSNVTNARSLSGKTDYNGECQRFAEYMTTGKVGLFPSAKDAANTYTEQGVLNPDVSNAPIGSQIYFAPDNSNENFGHVGISTGNGGFISATDNGVQEMPLSQWIQETGQTPIGYVPYQIAKHTN